MATFTIQDVVTEVRAAIQDERVGAYRYSDPFIVRVVNHSLKRIALTRPDIFAVIAPMSCVAGSVQTAPSDSIRIIDVLYGADGHSVNEVSQEAMDLALQTWQAGTTAPATDWMRHIRNPNQFLVYPPSANGQTLTIEYAQGPQTYAITDVVSILADAYFPVVIDCVVWWMESIDNESVASQRAQMFMQSWQQMLNVTVQNRVATDVPAAGLPPNQVV